MDDYAGRVLADRYRLPLPPADEYELVEARAFDTYSGQEVVVRQLPLPEVVDAEMVEPGDAAGAPDPSPYGRPSPYGHQSPYGRPVPGRPSRGLTDPAVRRAVEAAQAAARIPDHPRLDQVFDVFTEDGSLWIVSELVDARPLAALLVERPLDPYRAAEIGSDVLTALRALHVHGWTHRNITARTVLVCDDGRVVLTGLAAGAAEEALCGYAPVPEPDPDSDPDGSYGPEDPYGPGGAGHTGDSGDAGEADHPGAADAYDAGAYGRQDGHDGHDGQENEYGTGHRGAPGTGLGPVARAGYPAGYELAAAPEQPPEPPGGPAGPVRAAPAGYGPGPGGSVAPYGTPPEPPYGTAPGAGAVAPYGTPGSPETGHRRPGSAIAAYRAGARAAARADEAEAAREALDAARGRADSGRPPSAEPPWWAGTVEDDSTAPDEDGPHENGPYENGPYEDGPYEDGPYTDRTYADARYEDGPHEDRPYADPVDPEGPYGSGGPGRPGGRPHRAHLAGSWHDGPSAGAGREDDRPVPAGGGPVVPYGRRSAPAYDDRTPVPGHPAADHREPAGYRGPATPLAAERARQARIAMVGAVTERWAPEQAGPVHDTWQLAPPIGPATDLWALGALLYRAVQGHAPYPEENSAELVQLVCAEPPAFAEECGPLRPVVESLLRQDPTERPDVEELRGWLRSLVRSAPEPDAGVAVVPMPPADAARLPVVRRRGELVRRRRAAAAPDAAHGRHRQSRARSARPPERDRSPRALGRTLLVVILLVLAAAVAYAMLFLPESGPDAGPDTGRPGGAVPSQGQPAPTPGDTTRPSGTGPSPDSPAPSGQTGTASAPALAPGYALREDPEGFRLGVPEDWRRSPINDAGQVRYTGGDFTLIVVPGRDTVADNGADPMEYQRNKERELTPWRDSSWSSVTGLRRTDVGRQAMAEGQFTWQDSTGREVYVRNLALVVGGAYHVIQVIGPEGARDKVTEVYGQAITSYRPTR
ncbi:protein kinase [Streptomyces sp. LP05-1]|uniref:Protein kinase n=1 Tax=Streptomyces pyxinae TaxID=2970734 RepID=A0ABT2CKN3_9ACTN|nr:protein kinase [Streptomyces sp. LP05-1]MCS0637114.1 protein kinase [Streptomyces sp. LP05-1]